VQIVLGHDAVSVPIFAISVDRKFVLATCIHAEDYPAAQQEEVLDISNLGNATRTNTKRVLKPKNAMKIRQRRWLARMTCFNNA